MIGYQSHRYFLEPVLNFRFYLFPLLIFFLSLQQSYLWFHITAEKVTRFLFNYLVKACLIIFFFRSVIVVTKLLYDQNIFTVIPF